MTTLPRPVQLADVTRRARYAVSASAFALLPQRPDPGTAVRVARAPGEPTAALAHAQCQDTARAVTFWLRDVGYEVVPGPAGHAAGVPLLVRCGTATDSRLFEYVRDRCDSCFYDHDYDHELSEQLMRIIRELIPYEDVADYFEELETFESSIGGRHSRRLHHLHDHLGHGSRFHLNGRYVLARQPETCILLERATNAPDAFAQTFADSAYLPHLRDLVAAWEDSARQPA